VRCLHPLIEGVCKRECVTEQEREGVRECVCERECV